MKALIASPLGLAIGIALGALGGGGSILAVPALVYVIGQDVKAATATSLVIVGATSLVGVVPHWRAGRVRPVAGILFGLAGTGGSFLGSALNRAVNPKLLLLSFAALMAIASVVMWLRSRRQLTNPADDDQPADRTAQKVTLAVGLQVVAAGTVVGVLTGFFGVGGGFIVVPALVLVLHFPMPAAVGTSLVVITINTIAALLARTGSGRATRGHPAL